MEKKKLLVTGASGLVGYHLIRLANDRIVYGLSNKHHINFPEAIDVNCDIRDYISLGNLIEDIEPDGIIHLAAISDANYCQQNEKESYEVNVEATKNLAGICSDYNIPFTFSSTDLVFDGQKGNYKEDDAKNPVSIYGEQKATAEDEVLRIYPNSCVVRLPLMFGNFEATPSNYLKNFLAQLKRGEKVNLFYDEYRSVCGAKSIASDILQLFEKNSGIIHLAGPERVSRYDFGLKIAKAFSLDDSLLKSCSQKDIKMSAPRPADVSLDISKALALGFSPLTVDEELSLIANGQYL